MFPLSRKFIIVVDQSPMGILSIRCFFTIQTIHLKSLFLTAQWCVFNKMAPEAWHWYCHGFGWWKMRSQFSFQHSRDTGHEWERKLSGCLLHTAWHYRPLLTPSAWPRLLRNRTLSIPASSLSACALILSSCLLCESIAYYHHLLPFSLGLTSFHTLLATTHIFTYRGQRGEGRRRGHGVKEWMCEIEGRRELHQYVSFQFYSPEPRHGWHPL